MDQTNITPQNELKKMWFIIWSAITIIIALPLTAVTVFAPNNEIQIIFGIILFVFITIMVLVRIWIPAFYRSIEYGIDDDAVKMNCGVFFKRRVTVPFRKITNVDISQGPLQRMFNVGTIHVQTAGAGGAQGAQAELRFSGIRELDELKERIMDGVRGKNVPAEVIANDRKHDENRDSINELSILKDILAELKAVRTALEND
jgi:uncharacterized protein